MPTTVAVDAEVEIAALRQNLTELAIAYKELCEELGHISRHVAYHEKALKHIAKFSHGSTTTAGGHSGLGHTHGHGHGHGLGHGHAHAHVHGSKVIIGANDGHEHADDGHHHHQHQHQHPTNQTDARANEIQVSWPLGHILHAFNFFFSQLFHFTP